MHTPVLLEEVIRGLDIKKGKKYIDATYGEGGHSREIVKRGGQVLALDWDETQIQNLEFRIPNLEIVSGNFKDVESIAKKNNFYPIDGILFDLGLSMEQIGQSGRGFSFKRRADPLDMRIGQGQERGAADIINSLSLEELYEIFSANSEEVDSRPIAKAIFRASRIKRIETVGQLVDAIKTVNKNESALRRIFQALRIEVNDEFDNLKRGLAGAIQILAPGGKILVITFHSLEDRIVKNFVRENKMKLTHKKPIRSKSGYSFEKTAKLRRLTLNPR